MSIHRLGFLCLELLVRLRVRSIDHRTKRQDKGQRFRYVASIELGDAGHAGEIIRHHAADGAGRLARRVRAELAVARPQTRIDLVGGCTWLYAPLLASANPRMFRSSPLATGSG